MSARVWQFALGAAVGYCLADFIFGMVLGRCVLPWLKCRACRRIR